MQFSDARLRNAILITVAIASVFGWLAFEYLLFPMSRYTVEEIRGSPPPAATIGVCISRDFRVVQAVYPQVNIQFTRDQFIVPKVNAWKGGEPL